jgi:GTPase SAR1 family protein
MDILDTVVDANTSIAFSSMVDIWIQTVDGFLMVCSLTDSKSLEVADTILKKVYKIRNLPYGSIPIVLAANKCDLEVERTVQWEDVRTLACKYNIQNYLQTSAKTNHNVYTAFCKLAELAGCSFAEEFVKLEKGQSLQDQKKKCHVM